MRTGVTQRQFRIGAPCNILHADEEEEHGQGEVIRTPSIATNATRIAVQITPKNKDTKCTATWYAQADDAYIQKCQRKDRATTSAALGFKVCGMQVFGEESGSYFKASKKFSRCFVQHRQRRAVPTSS